MNPITQSVNVGRSREEVFEYLADIANLSEFSDHFLGSFHLTREESYGRGAGARFRATAALSRFGWVDLTYTGFEAPFRIVAEGHGGKNNRTRYRAEWQLLPKGAQMTAVELTVESEPTTITGRMSEAFGARGWVKRKTGRALKRLRAILEDGEQRGQRITIAAR